MCLDLTVNNGLFYGIAITALAVSDLLLILLGMLAYRLYHRFVEQPATPASAYEDLSQNLKILTVSMSVVSERLTRLENQLGYLRDHWEQWPMPSRQKTDRRAFDVATKMAQQGADVDALVNLCGLLHGEAELIHMLHRAGNQDSMD
jgi:hypothetical protein